MQKLFAENRPDVLLETQVKGSPLLKETGKGKRPELLPPDAPEAVEVKAKAGNGTAPAIIAQGGRIEGTGEIMVQLLNGASQPVAVTLTVQGARLRDGKAWVLTSARPEDENSTENPCKVSPREEALTLGAQAIEKTLPAYSVSVRRFKLTVRRQNEGAPGIQALQPVL